MTTSDPYALHNAFDDLPEYAAVSASTVPVRRHTVLERWRSAARRRRARRAVLGADLTGLRVDDDATYAEFRGARREPYVTELAKRLAALEAAHESHVADEHAHSIDRFERMLVDHEAREDGRIDRLERALVQHASDGHGVPIDVLGEAVVDAAVKARSGGEPIPVAPQLRGKVECWRDGGELCCTVRTVDGSGRVTFVTGTMPIGRCADDVVLGAADADVELEDFLAHAPSVAKVVGGESLLADVCGLAPSVLPGISRGAAASAYLHGTDVLIALHGRN